MTRLVFGYGQPRDSERTDMDHRLFACCLVYEFISVLARYTLVWHVQTPSIPFRASSSVDDFCSYLFAAGNQDGAGRGAFVGNLKVEFFHCPFIDR
jgi:hypothetical protein